MPSLTTDAIIAAATLHDGAVDKRGEPVILHALRVMLAGETEQERILGVLHDTVEDAGWGALRDHLDVPVWLEAALDAISRREGEAYESYIVRVDRHQLARGVKIRDLNDNLDPRRGGFPEMQQLRERYLRALRFLAGEPPRT
jgi:hypothetical protein